MPFDGMDVVRYVAVGALATSVAIGELLSRYHDDRPFRVILSPPGSFYLGVNALAAGLALYIVADLPTTKIASLTPLFQPQTNLLPASASAF